MKVKNVIITGIFIIAVFSVGVAVGIIFDVFRYIDIKTIQKIFTSEEKPIQSANLPKPTPTPIDAYTVEQLLNIDTTVAVKKFLYKTIETYGDLTHPETDIKDITFKINGYVEKLYADYTGKYVKKGEPLLTVYSPELVSAQEEFLQAYEYMKKMEETQIPELIESAKQLYDAAYKRLLYWDITPKQIENLKKFKKVQRTMTLYSPYDGWIMEKFVYLGSEVKAGKPVLKIARHRDLWLMAKVYEPDMPFIKIGQEVMIMFEAYPEKHYKGKIDYIYPMMDEKNRTVDVRIVIPNPNYQLTPGMYSKIHIKIPIGKKLVLPETAVLDTGKRQIVFVQTRKGVFEPVFVKIGRLIDGYYEIIDGIEEGTVVANSALFLLDADAQLRGKYLKKDKDKTQKPMIHHHH